MFKQKFKVWDEANQCWAKEKFALLPNGNLVNLGNLEIKYQDTHIPCMFTGFLASGQEIYVGDILEYDYLSVPCEIKHSRSVLAYGLEDAKIAGNIFQDPQLLAVA